MGRRELLKWGAVATKVSANPDPKGSSEAGPFPFRAAPPGGKGTGPFSPSRWGPWRGPMEEL